MVKRSMNYLDRLAAELAAESAADITLQRDAANGYVKLATVLGVPVYANLGDRKGARESIEKALRLWRAILAAHPDNVDDRTRLAWSLILQGQLSMSAGDATAAAAAHMQALREADWVLAKTPNPNGKQVNVAESAALSVALDLGGSAGIPQLGDPVAALPYYRRARELAVREGEIRAKLPNAKVTNVYRYSNLALVEISMARLYWYGLEQPEKAREHYERAFELLRTPGVDLNNAEIRRKLMTVTEDYGAFLMDRGQVAAALPYLRDGREDTHKVALQDTLNLTARMDDAFSELLLGRAEALNGNVASGFSGIDHGLQELRELVAVDPADAVRTGGLLYSLAASGETALSCGRIANAVALFSESSRRAEAASTAHPSDARARMYLSQAEHGLARCFTAQHEADKARDHDAKAAAAVKPVLDAHPDNAYARRLFNEATSR
jgi:tetratricopeptide (TPR) repeat protein